MKKTIIIAKVIIDTVILSRKLYLKVLQKQDFFIHQFKIVKSTLIKAFEAKVPLYFFTECRKNS